jgi:hypothetical protein
MKKAITKWKIGDLVTLSAAGKTVDQNHSLLKFVNGEQTCPGFGMVLHIKGVYERWPVQVQWFHGKHKSICFKDYELKRFKAPK